jgi:hypothetical protein
VERLTGIWKWQTIGRKSLKPKEKAVFCWRSLRVTCFRLWSGVRSNKLLALDFLKDANDDSVVELSEDEEKKDPADFGNHLTTFLIQ